MLPLVTAPSQRGLASVEANAAAAEAKNTSYRRIPPHPSHASTMLRRPAVPYTRDQSYENHSTNRLPVQFCGCKQKTTRRMVDPGPQFREAFEGINRIEFLTRDRGCFCLGHGIAAVDNREIIQRFFEILDFVPYEEGSSEHCDWECDEIVRTYSNYDQDDEFTIHHRNHDTIVRWHHQETDLKLTAESAAALKSYLADYAYAPAKHEMENKQAPLPRMLPPPTIPTSPTKTY